MEMFVGVGASRVRDMFQQARKNVSARGWWEQREQAGSRRRLQGAWVRRLSSRQLAARGMLDSAACIHTARPPFTHPFPATHTHTHTFTPSWRLQSPCILFIDEFDGLGKARSYGGGGNDESVHTINQLLTGGCGAKADSRAGQRVVGWLLARAFRTSALCRHSCC
jgi:hypothetical protein